MQTTGRASTRRFAQMPRRFVLLVLVTQVPSICGYSFGAHARPDSGLVSRPMALRVAQEPMFLLGRGKKVEDPVTDIPPLEQHPRRRIALLVEPTPFTHVPR